jgi:hypothetical protein
MTPISGHVYRFEGRRGPVWRAKYRLPDGRQVRSTIGSAWTERGRPRAGWYTKRTAEAWLRDVLDQAHAGTLPEMVRTGVTFADGCAEFLRHVEHDLDRKPSTVDDHDGAARQTGWTAVELGEQRGEARARDPGALFEMARRAPSNRCTDHHAATRLPSLRRCGEREGLSGAGLPDHRGDSVALEREPAPISTCSPLNVGRLLSPRSTMRSRAAPMFPLCVDIAWSRIRRSSCSNSAAASISTIDRPTPAGSRSQNIWTTSRRVSVARSRVKPSAPPSSSAISRSSASPSSTSTTRPSKPRICSAEKPRLAARCHHSGWSCSGVTR